MTVSGDSATLLASFFPIGNKASEQESGSLFTAP
jgi:hypothetical protein